MADEKDIKWLEFQVQSLIKNVAGVTAELSAIKKDVQATTDRVLIIETSRKLENARFDEICEELADMGMSNKKSLETIYTKEEVDGALEDIKEAVNTVSKSSKECVDSCSNAHTKQRDSWEKTFNEVTLKGINDFMGRFTLPKMIGYFTAFLVLIYTFIKLVSYISNISKGVPLQ